MAILSPTKEQADEIKILILNLHHKPITQLTQSWKEEAVHYPTEFLNSLTPPGIPQHKLILKVIFPIILQRH